MKTTRITRRRKAARYIDGRMMWQGWGLKFLCVPRAWDVGSFRRIEAFGAVNIVRVK